MNGCNHWQHGWKAKGWKRGQKPLANAQLWRELDRALCLVPIRLEWVKGHAGNAGNERADELAEIGRQAAVERLSRDKGATLASNLICDQLRYSI